MKKNPKVVEAEVCDPRLLTGLMRRLVRAVKADRAATGEFDADVILNALLNVATIMIDAHPDADERARLIATTRFYCDTELRGDEAVVKRWRALFDKTAPLMNPVGNA